MGAGSFDGERSRDLSAKIAGTFRYSGVASKQGYSSVTEQKRFVVEVLATGPEDAKHRALAALPDAGSNRWWLLEWSSVVEVSA